MLHFLLPISRVSVTLLFFFLSYLCQAQKNVFPGYFVDMNGDTVKGNFLNYRQLEKSPRRIIFQASSADRQIVLIPINIKYIEVKNYDSYISYNGLRMINAMDHSRVYEHGILNSEDKFDSVSVFLRLIASTPECDLYVLSDKMRLNLFYKPKDGPVTELIYKLNFINGNVIPSEQYKTQLLTIFEKQINDKRLESALEKLQYSESGIRSFANLLYVQTIKKPNQLTKEKRFVIIGGISLNTLNVKGDETFDVTKPDYDRTLSPVIGIGYMATIQRSMGKFFIYPQVKVYNFKNEGNTSEGSAQNKYVFKTSIIINPILSVGFNLKNEEKFKWYLAGGISALILSNNTYTNTRVYPTSTLVLVNETESFAINGQVQTGTVINRFILWGSYIVPARILDKPAYIAKHSGFQLGCGVKF